MKVRKATQNVEIRWFGWLEVTQGHRQHSHLIECIRLPIRLYVSILYGFRITVSYLSKVVDFNQYPTSHLHLALPPGRPRSNFAKIVGIRKQVLLKVI